MWFSLLENLTLFVTADLGLNIKVFVKWHRASIFGRSPLDVIQTFENQVKPLYLMYLVCKFVNIIFNEALELLRYRETCPDSPIWLWVSHQPK